MNTKKCSNCGEVKHVDNFYAHRRGLFGKSNVCKICSNVLSTAYAKENSEKINAQRRTRRANNNDVYLKERNADLIKKYGISLSEYRDMNESQGGKCAICHENGKLVVDHDHKTGKVRSLICDKHNLALGLVDDSPILLTAMAKYLIEHEARGINWNLFSFLGIFNANANPTGPRTA